MALIKMVTASGEEHGLVNILTNSVEFNDFKNMSPEIKSKLQKEKKEDARLVKAVYWNARGMHERLDKPYCRYAGDRIEQWHLIPGYEYELPMGFIKEVNGTEAMPQRSGLLTVDGKDINTDGSPLDKDRKAQKLHQLVPAAFQAAA